MNSKRNEIEIEEAITSELNALIALLQKKEEITRYQEIEKKIEKNQIIEQLIDQIKEKQKEIVNFEYYEKPIAYQKTLKDLNQLNQLLDENISVVAYKQSLWEANELVQILFKQIQDSVVEKKSIG